MTDPTKPDASIDSPPSIRRRGRRRATDIVTDKPMAPEAKTRRVTLVEPDEPSQNKLRKAVEAMTIRNVASSGEITFLQRKAFNAMLQIAQRKRQGNEVTFEVSIGEFEELVGQNTDNSRSFLKKMLRQLTTIQVEFDFKGDSPKRQSSWGVANLIAEVYLSPDGVIKFSFPSEMAKRLLDPATYNQIDMRMQNKFTSYSALTLFEIVSRYESVQFKETFHEHWTAWSVLLSGASKPHEQFRDFNKMLNRAVDQVNAQQDRFKVVPIFTKRERKIDKLHFKLVINAQAALHLNGSNPIINEGLKRRASQLGLTDEDIITITLRHNEEYVLAHIDYTEKRQKKKNADPLGNPRAYLMEALDSNYAKVPLSTPAAKLEKAEETNSAVSKALPAPHAEKTQAKVSIDSLRQAYKTQQLSRIKSEFEALEKTEQDARLLEIEPELQKSDTVWKMFKSRGLTKTTETVIFQIFLERDMGEVSTDTLFVWALENNLLSATV